MDLSILILPLIGGVLIGMAAAWLMLTTGRIAGISGILGGALDRPKGDMGWRLAFVFGLIVGGVGIVAANPALIYDGLGTSLPWVVLAGLLVGFGTRLGSGCTSGHGVCGISRFSKRSIIATMTFIAFGALSTYLVHHIIDPKPQMTETQQIEGENP